MSPSPIPSPHTASGQSSPLTSGGGAIPFHQSNRYSHMKFWSQGFGRNLQTTHACRGVVSSDNDALPNHSRRAVQGDPIEFRDEKSYLADCVSRQLLRDHVRLNACLDNKLHAPNPDCINGL
ncbi:hypothetical protein JHK85_013932 [Glycine max]|nr:hypothetical protein JHK85_013932 [Glycine max]